MSRRRRYRKNTEGIVPAAAPAPAKKDYGWILPVAGAAVGITAAVGIGYMLYKFVTGFKMPDLNPLPGGGKSAQEQFKESMPYADTWTKNQNGIEVDIHKYSKTGNWEVRAKAPTYPVEYPLTGLNYIVVYAFSGLPSSPLDSKMPIWNPAASWALEQDKLNYMKNDPGYQDAKNTADGLTQANINEALKEIVPGEVPQLIHPHQAKVHADQWIKNKYGIEVDFHKYSQTQQWEVRIKAPTYPSKWSQNNMNYIVVYAFPTIEQAAIAASHLSPDKVRQATSQATETENPVLVASGVGNMFPEGYQVGNRIVFQNGIIGHHHGGGGRGTPSQPLTSNYPASYYPPDIVYVKQKEEESVIQGHHHGGGGYYRPPRYQAKLDEMYQEALLTQGKGHHGRSNIDRFAPQEMMYNRPIYKSYDDEPYQSTIQGHGHHGGGGWRNYAMYPFPYPADYPRVALEGGSDVNIGKHKHHHGGGGGGWYYPYYPYYPYYDYPQTTTVVVTETEEERKKRLGLKGSDGELIWE